MAWEKKELIKNILIIILLSGAFILFISRTGQEALKNILRVRF